MMGLDHSPVIAPLYRLQFESVQGAWVLLYPEGMVKLNATAAEILRRCDGATTVEQLIVALERDFAPSDVREDVCRFLVDAHGRGWLVTTPPEAPSAPPPQGGAAGGPAEPDPRRPLGGA